MLISHRGNNDHNYKENTIKAIIDSLNANYIDGVEFDIRITKDNILVLNHNSVYNNKIIEKTNYNELKLDKLEDLLSQLKTTKLLLIEIKSEKNNKKIIDYLYKLLNQYNNLNIKICSFNYKILKYFKKKYKTYQLGLIIGETKNKRRFKNIFDFNSIKYIYLDKIKENDYVWTINDVEIYKKITKSISVITDIPYQLNK